MPDPVSIARLRGQGARRRASQKHAEPSAHNTMDVRNTTRYDPSTSYATPPNHGPIAPEPIADRQGAVDPVIPNTDAAKNGAKRDAAEDHAPRPEAIDQDPATGARRPCRIVDSDCAPAVSPRDQ